MKYLKGEGWKRKISPVLLLATLMGMTFSSCDPNNDQLGMDILPDSDSLAVYTDTITDIGVTLVRSEPRLTSLTTASLNSSSTQLLGSIHDTITGLSNAAIVTQIGSAGSRDFGDEPLVDSVYLWFYVDEVIGDTTAEFQLSIYELTDSISYDSSYFSDFDVSGMYDPTPIIQEMFVAKPESYYEFEITDPQFIDRLIAAASDTLFNDNALFQEAFYGFYFTTEAVTEGGALAKVQLADAGSGLEFRYLHDSVLVDTAEFTDYSFYKASFNDFNAQKINLFSHDYTGTFLESILDDENAEPAIAYAQGMAGVNVRLDMPDLTNYIDSGLVALNAAQLRFYVVSDSLSGIPVEAYPENLMLVTKTLDGTFRNVRDYLTNSNPFSFGKLNRSNEQSAFLPAKYFYSFQLGLHFQSIINGTEDNTPLYIYPADALTSNDIIKFWSNHSGDQGGLRLELIYTKF